jgi:hypothetical protein
MAGTADAIVEIANNGIDKMQFSQLNFLIGFQFI